VWNDKVLTDIWCGGAGTDSQRLLLMQISRTPGSTEEAHNFLVADYRGQISFATSGIAKILGYPPRDMLRLNISALMEAPFSYMHAKWLAVRPPAGWGVAAALLAWIGTRTG
jgi:PAS domain-containing protein